MSVNSASLSVGTSMRAAAVTISVIAVVASGMRWLSPRICSSMARYTGVRLPASSRAPATWRAMPSMWSWWAEKSRTGPMPICTPRLPAACMATPAPTAMPVCTMALACCSRSAASLRWWSAWARKAAFCRSISAVVAAMFWRSLRSWVLMSRVLMPAARSFSRSCCTCCAWRSCCWPSDSASRLARAKSRSMARVGGPLACRVRASCATLAWASVSLAAVSARPVRRVRQSPTMACCWFSSLRRSRVALSDLAASVLPVLMRLRGANTRSTRSSTTRRRMLSAAMVASMACSVCGGGAVWG